MLIDGYTLFGSWPGLPYDHPVEHLVEGMQRFQLTYACTLSSQGIFFDASAGNQTTFDACAQDRRLIPIGVADPRVGGLDQVEFCRTHGFRLMAMFPGAQGWRMDNLVAREVLEAIAQAQLPVMIRADRSGDASAIWQVTQDLPIPVILLDVSLPTLAEAMRVLEKRPHTYLATRLLCGGDTIEYLLESMGRDRLVFASRFPINCFSSAFLTAKFANITNEDRGAIMGGNMARLLGLA